MYKITGADGKEYGPVPAEQIRQWIAEGRANGQTRVQSEASIEWKPLSEFPEFADTLAAKTVASGPTGGPPPVPGSGNAEALAAQILARDYRVEIGSCVSRSWELVKRHFWLTVGTTFLVSLVSGVPLLAGVCWGGLFMFFLKLIRTDRAEVSDGFSGFSQAFLQLFLAGLIIPLLVSLGLFLCLLPGIYLAVAWKLAWLLIIDKRMDFWPAMEVSRKVVTKVWWQFFLLLLVNGLLMVLGFLACFIGTFITMPIVVGAITYAYEDIFGARPAPAT